MNYCKSFNILDFEIIKMFLSANIDIDSQTPDEKKLQL
jgi:hypothetical protein